MFWKSKQSIKADAYVNRIRQIMFFAASLAGKNKQQVVSALRDGLGIEITNVIDPEGHIWGDSKMEDLAVSFTLNFKNSNLVDQIQIAGYGVIDKLFVSVNGLEDSEPSRVNFGVDILGATRPTPALTKIVAKKLMQHSDFECEPLGTVNILMQRKHRAEPNGINHRSTHPTA